jgi:hypothetical protein
MAPTARSPYRPTGGPEISSVQPRACGLGLVELQGVLSVSRYNEPMSPDTGPLAVLEAWIVQHPRYAYTTQADERDASGGGATATLRVTYDATSKTETLHVVSGHGAGSDIRWTGGPTVDVRGPGLVHMISARMSVRDARILSPHGNDVRTAVFSRVVGCFVAEADRVRVVSRSVTANVIMLTEAAGEHCGDEYGPAKITADRLTLDPADGHPLMRERLNGTSVVERWTIRDLQTP